MENLLLSICIATYNRGCFIAETLDSILDQMEEGVELVIVDGASSDNTQDILTDYVSRYPRIRYFREAQNSGVDQDYDKAVGYAKGRYCWLMSDDDLFRPGAVKRVLSVLSENNNDLLIVNAEVKNADLSVLLTEKRLNINSDRTYGPSDLEQFFLNNVNYLGFIGCVVIKREFWLSRDRINFYGTLFIHVGVIFQHPPVETVRVIAQPFITIRDGNAGWTPRAFEIWAHKWPELIWSFPDISTGIKKKLGLTNQWCRFRFLFFHRAMGTYSLNEYHKYLSEKKGRFAKIRAYFIAVFPAWLANMLTVVYYAVMRRRDYLPLYDIIHSKHTTAASRFLARAFCGFSTK